MSDIRVHPIDNKHIAWPHRVVDNFFSEKELQWVEGYFEYGLKELRKKYWPLFDKDGNMLPSLKLQEEAHKHRIITPSTATNGFSVFVPFWSTERYIEVIDDIWKEASKIYPWERNNDIRRKDYFCFLELNIYPPQLDYNYHVDIKYKTLTSVVYIGKDGDGTTLKSNRNELDVVWKHNRGLVFMNCDKERRQIVKEIRYAGRLDDADKYTSLHKYQNKTDNVRFAVNMNVVHINNIGSMLSKGVLDKKSLNFRTSSIGEILERPFRKFEPILLRYEPTEKQEQKSKEKK
tara:strand:+ start:1156 stop:2025 length:870 start_codon:yes stop_codon:yes gene_type:complete